MEQSKLKINILLAIISSIIGLIFLELLGAWYLQTRSKGFRSILYRKSKSTLVILNRIFNTNIFPKDNLERILNQGKSWAGAVSYSPNAPYKADELLGYSLIPGNYEVTLRKSDQKNFYHKFNFNIDANGHRITSNFSDSLIEKDLVWIFGDSYTFGWANNDETSYPFLLQSISPNCKIVNYADNGYGNIHALIQLKKELPFASKKPKAIIITYGDYYDVRNSASPLRLAQYQQNVVNLDKKFRGKSSDSLTAFKHPRGVIKNGKFSIEMVDLFPSVSELRRQYIPSEPENKKITLAILKEISELSKKYNSKLYLTYNSGDYNQNFIDSVNLFGYSIIDVRPRSDMLLKDNYLPLDSHPGPKTLNWYSRQVSNKLDFCRKSTK